MPTKNLQNIKPGELWWVELSDNTVGHETQKTRPCLVLANSTEGKMITIIPLQSNLGSAKIPNTYLIKKNQKNKLKNDSVAIIFQIRSLDYSRFKIFIGNIDNKELNRIRTLLKYFFNL
jgi:mRNA interferase MazF